MLSDSPDDVFNAIFMTKVDIPILRYDVAARYFLIQTINNISISIPHTTDSIDPDSPSHSFSSIKRTTSILQRALTTRITTISVTAMHPPTFSISSSKPTETTKLTLGVLVDPESSRRLVDHGPPATDTVAATQFRSFWGDKAELRRFKDGSILESVVWNCKPTEDKYGIVKRIIRYVLARHISAGVAGDTSFLTPTLYPILLAPSEVGATYTKTEGDAFHSLSEAFEQFVRHLKDLKDMPLAISAIVPVSEGLTHTSVYSPYPQNYAKLSTQPAGSYHIPIHKAVIQLEGSGKWPDDLRAIQKVKVGLLLHIAQQLEKSHNISARVGLENPDLDISNTGFLDVIYEHGHSFRLRIQHDANHREAALIERALKNKSLSDKERTRYESALRKYHDTFIRGTAHAQALTALRGKFFFLPHTIRLVKRWFAAHLLSPQISSRVIELIVCYIYIHPHPWATPASAEVGFLRTLKFLATWDWRKDPLVVDLDGSVTSARHEGIVQLFEGVRKQDPGITHAAWSIYTSYDATGSCWTKEKPVKAVAARVTALAKSSLGALSQDSGNVKVVSSFMKLICSKFLQRQLRIMILLSI
jgi:U3 small nucleolar RNA-associated protein 22